MPFKSRKRQAPIGSETPYHPGTRMHGLARMRGAGVSRYRGLRTDGILPAGRRHGINRAKLEINTA